MNPDTIEKIDCILIGIGIVVISLGIAELFTLF